jgi:hypothetical protein
LHSAEAVVITAAVKWKCCVWGRDVAHSMSELIQIVASAGTLPEHRWEDYVTMDLDGILLPRVRDR